MKFTGIMIYIFYVLCSIFMKLTDFEKVTNIVTVPVKCMQSTCCHSAV